MWDWRLAVGSVLACLLGLGCATGQPAESGRVEIDFRTSQSAVETAIPDRALLVFRGDARGWVDRAVPLLSEADGETLEDRPRAVAGAALDILLTDARPGFRQLTERLSRPEVVRRVEHLDLDGTFYLALAEPRDPQLSRLLEYGGTLPAFSDVRNAVRGRLSLPSDAPDELASDLEAFVADGDDSVAVEGSWTVDVRTVDSRVVVDFDFLRAPGAPAPSGDPNSDSSPVPERFGLEEVTPAFRAFIEHDADGLYFPLESLRRISALTGLLEAQSAIQSVNPSSKPSLTLRGTQLAIWPLAMDAADRADYADIAVVNGRTPEDVDGYRTDALLSATQRGRETVDDERDSWRVPVPEVDRPVIQGRWFGPSDRAPETPRDKSLRARFIDDDVPPVVAEALRYGGVSTYAALFAAIAEAPSDWGEVLLSSIRRSIPASAVPEEVDDGLDSLRLPTVMTASIGWESTGRRPAPLEALRGGVALGWSTDRAPRWLSDLLPGAVETRWTESDDRAYLLMALDGSVDEVFPDPETGRRRPAGITVDLQPFLDDLEGRRRKSVERMLGNIVKQPRFHVTTATGPAGRVLRFQSGGTDRPEAPRKLRKTPGVAPDPSTWAARSCRDRQLLPGTEFAHDLEGARPESRGKLFEHTTRKLTDVADDCADTHPDHAAGFRHAAASWDGWSGMFARRNLRFRTAAATWKSACERGWKPGCEYRRRLGDLAGWSHLPVGAPSAPLPSDIPTGKSGRTGLWTVRVNRDGATWLAHEVPGGRRLSHRDPAGARGELEARLAVGEIPDHRPDSIVAAPDLLTPASELEPFARQMRSDDGQLHVAVTNTVDFDRHQVFTSTHFVDLSVRAGDDASEDRSPDAVVRLTRRGIDLALPDGSVSAPDRCEDDGPTFCLLEGRDSIDGPEQNLREALDDADGAARDALRPLIDAYPLHELHAALKADLDGKAGSFARIEIARDVPMTVVPQLITAVLYKRGGDISESLSTYRNADVATSTHKYREVPVELVHDHTVEIVEAP